MSSADLVIKNHQGIKAEIEARADRFSSCIEMGQGLLARNHYAAEEVGEAWAQPGHLPGAGLNADFLISLSLSASSGSFFTETFHSLPTSVLFRDFPIPSPPARAICLLKSEITNSPV